MNIKKIIVLILLVSFTGLIFYLFQYKNTSKIDIIAINDITQSLAEGWEDLEQSKLPGLNYNMDYVVLDNQNQFIRATKNGLNNNLNSAISNRDTIIDINFNNSVE